MPSFKNVRRRSSNEIDIGVACHWQAHVPRRAVCVHACVHVCVHVCM